MKQFRLNIDTDNAAFEDGNREAEIARILTDLAEKLEIGHHMPRYLRDGNGNAVGLAQDVERGQLDPGPAPAGLLLACLQTALADAETYTEAYGRSWDAHPDGRPDDVRRALGQIRAAQAAVAAGAAEQLPVRSPEPRAVDDSPRPFPVRAITVYGVAIMGRLLPALVARSIWFSVMPLPYDEWELQYRPDAEAFVQDLLASTCHGR